MNEKSAAAISKPQPTLAQAYWLYGVVANVAISIAASGIWGTRLPPGPLLAWMGYNIWVQLLIWTAAKNYAGRPLWKGLAQAAVVIGWALIAVTAVGLVRVLLSRVDDLQPGASIFDQLFW